MFAYIPFVILGSIVYRVLVYSPERVSTRDKQTQTEPWCGMNILDLMDVETDSSSSWECEINSSNSSCTENTKKNV